LNCIIELLLHEVTTKKWRCK